MLHSEFPDIRGKFDFLFYQCVLLAYPILILSYTIPPPADSYGTTKKRKLHNERVGTGAPTRPPAFVRHQGRYYDFIFFEFGY